MDNENKPDLIDAVEALLGIGTMVAELQTTDEGAEAIYSICDRVAEHFGIESRELEQTDNPDGSITLKYKDDKPKPPKLTVIDGKLPEDDESIH